MPMAEREPFLKEHPDVEQIPSTINVADPVMLGVTQPPSDFQKHIIGRMADSLPGNKIRYNSKFKIPREF